MERKEGLAGACKYCGQIVPTRGTTQEEADRIATEECTCSMASAMQKRVRSIQLAKEIIDELFPRLEDERNTELAISLKNIVDEIAAGRYRAITIQVSGKVSVSLSMTGKGTIKVARTDKTKQSYETVE